MRVIVLLLAVIMMAGTAAQGAAASPDVAIEIIDDAPDVGTPVMPARVAVPVPGRRGPVRIEAPPPWARGRMHAVLVFRPPRLIASR